MSILVLMRNLVSLDPEKPWSEEILEGVGDHTEFRLHSVSDGEPVKAVKQEKKIKQVYIYILERLILCWDLRRGGWRGVCSLSHEKQ